MTASEGKGVIALTINGRGVEVREGATLLEAARAAGMHIPTLCHHPGLPARAVCRMCLVTIDGEPTPQPACSRLARAGDRVETEGEDIRALREADAEWMLARHPNDCMRCEVNGDCQLQRLVNENQWGEKWGDVPAAPSEPPGRLTQDHTSPSIWRDLDKCIECGLCAEICGEAGQGQFIIGFAERGIDRLPVTVFDRPLGETDCISCGQCTRVCPVGALIEAPQWRDVLRTLDSRQRVSVVQVAPATRVAISEEFGMKPGTVSTGRLINALRQLGFDYVFDTNFAADLTIMEEANELIGRIAARDNLPLFTSCCPGWVNWVEIHRPDLLPHLSTTKSPQQMHGAVAKRGRFARGLGPEFASGRAEPYVVSLMPCTAKKDEALRPGMSGDVDHVLTTRELGRMIRSRGVAFSSLAEDGRFDSPLGEGSGAAQIFGASGGVMEAIARAGAHLRGLPEPGGLEWRSLRGVKEGVRSAIIPGMGRVAVCNGIAAAQRLLETDDWREIYVAIEVMACVGGCLGGGGEPKSLDPDILRKRSQSIYAIDRRATVRRSHENSEVQRLYDLDLVEPNSPAAKALLHTHYAARGSKRSLLMRFLDHVDRRESEAAADLFHPDGVWSTASPFGDVSGAAGIEAFIRTRLPPRELGHRFARHRMASAAALDDLKVIAPSGELCEFTMEVCAIDGDGRPRTVIRSLIRRVL